MLDPSLHGDFNVIFGFTVRKAVELLDMVRFSNFRTNPKSGKM